MEKYVGYEKLAIASVTDEWRDFCLVRVNELEKNDRSNTAKMSLNINLGIISFLIYFSLLEKRILVLKFLKSRLSVGFDSDL